MYIYKDYLLENGILYKTRMNSQHLLYKSPFNGSPAIDADNVWDKYKDKIQEIRFKVFYKNESFEVFSVKADVFENNKQVINFGFGNQYALPKNFWNIYKVSK